MTTVTLEGARDTIELSMTSTPSDGFILANKGLTDWYGGAESKSDVNERPQADGAFAIGADWSSSLAVSVKGFFLGASYAEAVRAARRVAALRSGGRKVNVVVTDPLGATSRLVSVRRVTIPDFGDAPEFEFTIDMVAADPLAYGAAVSASTSVPSSGGGMVWDAPAGLDPLVGALTYPGDDVFPSVDLFPGGFE